jgi:hypothetical protein
MPEDDELLLVGFAHSCRLGPGSEAGGHCSVKLGLAPVVLIYKTINPDQFSKAHSFILAMSQGS